MWLTGFDVPALSTLYLDKPLKAHTLMQAIARANRVSEGKNNGLIVDYCGILKNLRKALATFAGQGDQGHGNGNNKKDPARPNEELLSELIEVISMVRSFLKTQGFNLNDVIEKKGFDRNASIIEAKEAVNECDRTRKQFEVMAREVFKKFKACINIRPEINNHRVERDVINIIYKSLQADREQVDISKIMMQLHAIVGSAIETTHPQVAEAGPYDISQIDFERLRNEFKRIPQKRTTVQNLRQAIADRLRRLLEQNPLRTDFQKHYEDIVKEYNREKDRGTIEKSFAALLKLYEMLDEEEKRAIREGLDQETIVLFDLLKKPDLSKKETNRIKAVAADLLETLKKERLQVANWREKEATRDAVRQQIYDFLFDETTGLPVDSYDDSDIQIITDDVFSHVYRAYPQLPSPIYSSVVAF